MLIQEARIAFFDTETETKCDLPLEISACLSVNGKVESRFATLVDIGRPIHPDSTAIHGIDDAKIRENHAPPLVVAVACFEHWMRDVKPDAMAAHNLRFDKRIMEKAAQTVGKDPVTFFIEQRMFCTLNIARKLTRVTTDPAKLKLPRWVYNHKLEYLRQKFLGKTDDQSHRAECDVMDLIGIFLELLKIYNSERPLEASLASFLSWAGVEDIPDVFSTSKYPGVPIEIVWRKDPGYCRWMLERPNLEPPLRAGILKHKPKE